MHMTSIGQLAMNMSRLRVAAIVSGLLCSCAGPAAMDRAASPVPPAPTMAAAKFAAPTSSDETAGAASVGKAAVQLVQHTESAEPSGHNASVPADGAITQAATFTPAERRLENPALVGQACPIGAMPACPPGCRPGGGCPPIGGAIGVGGVPVGPRGIHTDEYLCDGGDRRLPVHYDRIYRNGLNTEDTVGEWTDPAGGHHVVPSNKVCVYAPRFGEVQSFSVPVGGTKVTRLVAANDVQHGAGLDARMYLDTEVQETVLNATRVRTRASGFNRDTSASGFGQVTSIALNLRDTPPVVGTGFLTSGMLRRGEEAFIAEGMQAAVTWTRTQFPVITATNAAANEVRAEFGAEEMVGIKDMDKPGHLRIVKLADKKAASTGDVITFTIRYDNLGDKPIHHVRIVDNLTPRLEFIEGSASSDREGRVDIEPNGEGSFVLTFVIEGAVDGKSGGTVTFEARVK